MKRNNYNETIQNYQSYEQLHPQWNKGFWWPKTNFCECRNWEIITAKNDVFKKHLKNNRNRYCTYKYKALH